MTKIPRQPKRSANSKANAPSGPLSPQGSKPPPSANDHVLVREFAKAEDLMAALHPLAEPWATDPPTWVFRGHGDSTWQLVPAAYRLHEWVEFGCQDFGGKGKDEVFVDPLLEAMAFERFARGLDLAGHELPRVRDAWEPDRAYVADSTAEDWPSSGRIPVLALAQHLGLPTRLLDWTWQGRCAAYFAAATAARRLRKTGRLEVWALHAPFVEEWGGHGLLGGIKVHLESAPLSSNENLRAQDGVFTVCRGEGNAPKVPIALDGVLGAILEVARNVQWASQPTAARVRAPVVILQRLQLPHEEARKLLRLLAAEKVTAARLFPGRDGVRREMSDEHYWDVLPSRARLRRHEEG